MQATAQTQPQEDGAQPFGDSHPQAPEDAPANQAENQSSPELQEPDGPLNGLQRLAHERMEQAFRRLGLKHMRLLVRKRSGVTSSLRELPDRMQKVTNQAKLVLELVDDFRAKRYRDIPWHAIAIAALTLVYSVSPADVIPDAIPALGALDDMVVIAVGMRLVQKHLRRYCEHKGYDPADYF